MLNADLPLGPSDICHAARPGLQHCNAFRGDTSNFEWYELHITSGFNVTPDCTTDSISWPCAVQTAAPPTHCLLNTPSVAHRVKTFYKFKPQMLISSFC